MAQTEPLCKLCAALVLEMVQSAKDFGIADMGIADMHTDDAFNEGDNPQSATDILYNEFNEKYADEAGHIDYENDDTNKTESESDENDKDDHDDDDDSDL